MYQATSLLLTGLLLTTACSEPSHRRATATEPKPMDPSHPASPEWTDIKARIRKTFPGVTEISTAELASLLETTQDESTPTQPGTGRMILLDARPEAEYAVSHLLGARRFEPSLLQDIPKDSLIVVYCSVGYRSAELAMRLEKLGYGRVRNLIGSIFQWANEGRPLYRASEKVHRVHPYDRKWGRLLDPSYR